MDREAAVIRQEMSHTRASLDRKITMLEERARQMAPRAVWERKKPDYLAERVIGAVLTLVGLRMAWGMYKARQRHHREHLNEALVGYERWE